MRTLMNTFVNILLFVFICILYVIVYPFSLIEDFIYRHKRKSRESEKAAYYHRYL